MVVLYSVNCRIERRNNTNGWSDLLEIMSRMSLRGIVLLRTLEFNGFKKDLNSIKLAVVFTVLVRQKYIE